MSKQNIHFEIKTVNHFAENVLWLDELSKLRAKTFYAEGQRPAFRLANGDFYDPDNFDKKSYHILAYDYGMKSKKLAGAVRLLPLVAPEYHCVASEIVGDVVFKKMLNFFKPGTQIMEVNRFFVSEEYQHHVLGMNLCAAAWWFGHLLGYSLITNGNIKLVRSLYIKYLGGVMFPDSAGPYYSELYNDHEIYILNIDKKLASPYLLEQVEVMKTLLPLENLAIKSDSSSVLET